MDLIIGLLTFILVLLCALLTILILAQLPKKDAGAGLAFGGGTAEAIFGAGAGTPLAQITKHCTTLFLILALTLSALNTHRSKQLQRHIQQQATQQQQNQPTNPTTPTTTTTNQTTNQTTDQTDPTNPPTQPTLTQPDTNTPLTPQPTKPTQPPDPTQPNPEK